MNDLENKIDYVDQIYACNEPLSRTGSFVIPTGLLAQSSLDDDEPLSTGGFLCAVISSAWLPPAQLPFLPGSRFPRLSPIHHRKIPAPTTTRSLQPTHYRNLPSIFKYISAYGSFIFLPPCCRLHITCCLLAVRPWPIPGGFQVRRSAYPLAVVGFGAVEKSFLYMYSSLSINARDKNITPGKKTTVTQRQLHPLFFSTVNIGITQLQKRRPAANLAGFVT
ncbi:hypothetical protein T01_9935 [Trichinella spiralis]|uniref:Uncharacterized protein n=1 Tax=Trichinella spiralis TaxID=6334 RepID=A0A0V1BJZ7_TRISP|nr:hypothetical protein T01_9935 [Trichinella spiralis]